MKNGPQILRVRENQVGLHPPPFSDAFPPKNSMVTAGLCCCESVSPQNPKRWLGNAVSKGFEEPEVINFPHALDMTVPSASISCDPYSQKQQHSRHGQCFNTAPHRNINWPRSHRLPDNKIRLVSHFIPANLVLILSFLLLEKKK